MIKKAPCAVSADEVKRIKGLGCLRDKRYPHVFNVRVIKTAGTGAELVKAGAFGAVFGVDVATAETKQGTEYFYRKRQ